MSWEKEYNKAKMLLEDIEKSNKKLEEIKKELDDLHEEHINYLRKEKGCF